MTDSDKDLPQSPPPKRMPLFIIKTLLFAVLIMLGLSFLSLDYLVSGGDDIENRAAKLIERLGETAEEDEVTVILLGDSRLRYAWRYGDTPETTVTLPDGRVMRNVKITQDNGIYKQFAPLEDAIVKADPDVLILEYTLFYRQSGEPDRLGKIRKLPYLMAFKAALWGDSSDHEWLHQQYDRVCTRKYSKTGFEQRARKHFTSSPPDFQGEEAREAREFIRRMVDAGPQVVMMYIPANIRAAERLGVDPVQMDNIYLEERPSKTDIVPPGLVEKLEWIAFEERDDIHDFCDLVHMTEATSEEFAGWLKSRIAQIAE